MADIAPFFLVFHFWRCTLVAALCGDYATALICVMPLNAIGTRVIVNSACGRYLSFFLDCLVERIQNGRGSPEMLEADEEMLAYASADMQGSHETAWAWTGGEVLQRTLDHTATAAEGATSAYDHAMGEEPEWNGWTRVMDILSQLEQEQHRSMQQQGPPPTTGSATATTTTTTTTTTTAAAASSTTAVCSAAHATSVCSAPPTSAISAILPITQSAYTAHDSCSGQCWTIQCPNTSRHQLSHQHQRHYLDDQGRL
jgi:hypothetical protein